MFIYSTYNTESNSFIVESDVDAYENDDPFGWAESIEIEFRFNSSSENVDHEGFSFGWDTYQDDEPFSSESIPHENESIRLLKSSYVLYGTFEGEEEKNSKVVFWADRNGERVSSELNFVFPRHPVVIPDEFEVKFAILGDD